LRWGILSTARIGRTLFVPGVHASAESSVVAVGSRTAEAAQAYARECRIERAHGSYEALLADPDVDAIYNPLPNSLHAEWTIKAARRASITVRKTTRADRGGKERMAAACLANVVLWGLQRRPPAHARPRLIDKADRRASIVRASFLPDRSRPDQRSAQASLEAGR
jgi:hypothetical protein